MGSDPMGSDPMASDPMGSESMGSERMRSDVVAFVDRLFLEMIAVVGIFAPLLKYVPPRPVSFGGDWVPFGRIVSRRRFKRAETLLIKSVG